MTNHAVVCIPDAKLRGLFSLLLADSGALVAACPDLDEVLRVVGSRFCQLCVLTQGMTADIAEAVEAVRNASPDTKILLIANREEVDAVLPLFSKGLSDAILQPINPKRAVAALQALLGKERPVETPAAGGTNSPFGSGAAAEAVYRPQHLIARSPAMRRAVNELWAARKDPIGVILRGEPGVEFELAVREFQAINGDPTGYVVVLSHHDLDVETLATQLSLERLNDGVPKTYFVPEVEKLTKEQGRDLLDFLRRVRRQRETVKPLRMVFAAANGVSGGVHADSELLEALQFIMPSVVTLPPMRERRDDVELIVRKVLMDLTALFPAYRARSLHPAALQWLCARPWPGNYQELLVAIRTTVINCGHREIMAGHFGKLTELGSTSPFDPDEVAAARMLAAAQKAVVR
jgi:DNA-binding NtrC family response regulator